MYASARRVISFAFSRSAARTQFDELMGFIRKEVEFFGKKMN